MSTPTGVGNLQIERVRVGEQVAEVAALTSLAALPDGDVLIGTTTRGSEQPVLLRLDVRSLEVTDTGFRFPLKGAPGSYAHSVGDKIHNAIALGRGPFEGQVLVGHGSHIWWDSGGWPFDPRVFPGGAVYAVDLRTHEARTLGVPVHLNTIHGLFGGEEFAVGFSIPDNHFFCVDYATGETLDFGKLSAYCAHQFVCHGHQAFGAHRRSVGVQRGDRVLADEHAAFLFVYDRRLRRLTRTTTRVADLDTNIRFNVGIDSWLSTAHGLLGGRVDGTLFLLDPQSLAICELGHAVRPPRPRLSQAEVRQLGGTRCSRILGAERVTALAALDADRVIGAAGFPTMHLFLLDLATRQKTDLGAVNAARQMCYFHDLAVVREDSGRWTVIVSETDSGRPDLYVIRAFDPDSIG
jgi:hypothetical protein